MIKVTRLLGEEANLYFDTCQRKIKTVIYEQLFLPEN